MNPIVALPEPLIIGLHAIGFLAKEPGVCFSTRQIAHAIGTTGPNLSKVMQRLKRGGYVKSVKGPGGGYKFNCVPGDVVLKDIFEFLGGPFELKGCSLEGCRNSRCFIGDMIDELIRAFMRYLESRTLADFVAYYRTETPVEIELSVITPSLGQKHPNFPVKHKNAK